MSINKFYTLFWVVYFPLCIAFYHFISFDYIDEILTLTLVIFTFTKLGVRRDDKIMKEVAVYLLLMLFYVIYSLLIQVTSSDGVWLDLQQQLRPYAVFYTTWMLAPEFTKRQKKIILDVMLFSTVVYAAAFLAGVRVITAYGNTESAVLGQLSLITGMMYFVFKPQTRFNALVAILIVGIGVWGGKSKFFGEYVAFIALVWFLKNKVKLGSIKTTVQFAVLTTVVLFFTWTKFNAYYVAGMFDKGREIARPESYKAAVQIMADYVPFGSGLGSFGTNAALVHYSPLYYKYKLDDIWGLSPDNPMFLADAFYPTLAQYGLFGLVLFFLFWKRRYNEVRRIRDMRYYKMGLMCILALALESTADTSYLSGKGMGYFMLLAICISQVKIERRRLRLMQMNDDEKSSEA